MRTTVTLDAESDAIVRRLMRERGLTFKQALNAAIRAGGLPGRRRPISFPTYDMGQPLVPLEKALRVAADLEDEALLRKQAERR